MKNTEDHLVSEEVKKKDEKAETIVNVEEIDNKDSLHKNTLDEKTNIENKLDIEGNQDQIKSENVVETFIVQQISSLPQHDSKQLHKSTHWVQYNKALVDQNEARRPKQSFGREALAGGNFQPSGAPLDYDPQTRNVFVKLVFVILLVMLLLTAAYAVTVLVTPGLKKFYIRYGLIIMITGAICLFVMNCGLVCLSCARVPPCNFIFLACVVVAMSNVVAAVTVRYKTHILVYALVATTVTVFVCILLACSSFDFTKFYIYIVVIAIVFMMISMMVSIAMLVMKIKYKPLQIVLLFVGGIINVVVLIMELQMVLGGKAVELGEDDYALGAYLLYTSIIDVFLKIVQLLGLADD